MFWPYHGIIICKEEINKKYESNKARGKVWRESSLNTLEVLKKCTSKFDCSIYKMLFIKDFKSSLNTVTDSIRGKLFTWILLLLYIFKANFSSGDYTHRAKTNSHCFPT